MTPQELKNSILQLAIQGKLVEQRPEEGTAEELYQQIQAEKQKLIKEEIIKKEKPLPTITEEEKPFDIPENWKWIRLGEYSQKITDQVASGSFASLRANVPSLKEPSYAIMVKTADFSNGFTRNLTYTDQHGYEFLKNSNLFGGELILSNIGSIGKCFVVPKLNIKMTLAPNSVMVRLVNDEQRDYLYYFILSPLGYQELLDITSGTAMKKFNKTDLKSILVPVPPLSEQKRIVAKIEELLPLIDRYEKAWSRLEEFNKRFPDDMQKSILQMAIQGKLVEQRPEEGTGEELYRQIQAEKQKLIKEGKIKKEKPLPEITEEEKPFDIPESWKWIRLESLSEIIGDGIHGTPEYDSKGDYYFINGNNLLNGNIVYKADTQKVSSEEYQKHKKTLRETTVLLSINGTIGNIAYYNNEPIILGKSACYITLLHGLYRPYLRILLKSKHFMDYALQEATQTTIKNVSLKAIRTFPVPLPPLTEQKRIVTRIEELLPLCDKLK